MQCTAIGAARMLADILKGVVVVKELECHHKCMHYISEGFFVLDALLAMIAAHESLRCETYWQQLGNSLYLGNNELEIVATKSEAFSRALAAAIENAEEAFQDHFDALTFLLSHFAAKEDSKEALSTMLTLLCGMNWDVRESFASYVSSEDVDTLLLRCRDCYNDVAMFLTAFEDLTLTEEQLIMLHEATLKRQPDADSLRAAANLLLDKGLDDKHLRDIASWAARAPKDAASEAVDLLYDLAKNGIFLPAQELDRFAKFLPQSPKLAKINRLAASNGDGSKVNLLTLPNASI